MNDKDRQDLINRLQGFDDEVLRDVMTDGLDEWCHRRQRRARTLRRLAAVVLLLLTTTALAMSVVPQWRSAIMGGKRPAAQPAMQQPTPPRAPALPADTVAAAGNTAAAVDYHYVGRSEEGYSVTYGRDSRTLIYTRRVGNRIVSSFVHNASDSLFVDSVTDSQPAPDTVGLPPDTVTQERIVYDFLSVSPQGDTLLYAIVDSARRCVSVYSDEDRFGRCHDSLVLPAWVSHNGVRYAVTSVSANAFAGAAIRALVLPAGVQVLDDSAFVDCWRLRRVTVLGEVPPMLGTDVFASVSRMALLVVPCRAADAYDAAPRWGESFRFNIEEDCSGVADPEVKPATIQVGRGTISVADIDENVWWGVYTPEGHIVCYWHGEGTLSVQRSGTYIVRVGNQPSQQVVVSL